MKLRTKLFGDIEIDVEKKLYFEQGLIGLPEMKAFFLIHDIENDEDEKIIWLQSADDMQFALPVINPLLVDKSYNPDVEDELLAPLGELGEEGLLVFITLRVPADITNMTVNMKAPLLINVATRKGCQVMVEGDSYKVRQPVYELLKKEKEGKGE